MQYTLVLSALAALVAAADRPSFLNDKFQITEGENFTFKFNNCQGGCTIVLKTGSSGNLKDVKTITTGATGESFTWTPSGLPSGTYAFYIKNNGNGLDNYSKQFTYSGTGATASTTDASSTASETASSTEASSTTASSTASSTTDSSTTLSKTTSAASTTSAPSSTTSQSSTSTRSTTAASTTVPNGGARATPMAFVAGAVAALAYLG
ncbi:extracellular matrix protein precursor [Pochonia chlamydosporia 170]|uniref:Extracellular matrix protein n=1 Tax=Pochonia chlamydosporia 170 TaxID=1380566 RepID=A0A179G3J3_METCM|nr:extracellular matrix protein precursor [Pochonia chlamydosporia 170]OAQ72434.1 extracellular matrix protein precursor [Pochonia chlamydosporia 170]